MTDWNWFFSALAQSAAAIVGVSVAFVVAKIINNEASFSSRLKDLEALMATARRLHDQAQAVGFRSLDQQISDMRKELRGRVPEHALPLPLLAPTEPLDTEGDDRSGFLSRPQEEWLGRVAVRRERAASLLIEVRHHASAVRQFSDILSSQPERSSALYAAIIVSVGLFFAGVVYPLSFLPLEINTAPRIAWSLSNLLNQWNSLSGWLLTAFSTPFVGLMCYLWWKGRRLIYSVSVMSALQPWQDEANYTG